MQDFINLKVYYALIPGPKEQGVGFNVQFKWDIPMMEGYDWGLLPNWVKKPSLNSFFSSRIRNIVSVFKRDNPHLIILTGWQSLPLLQALWACKRLRLPCCVRGESNTLKKRSWWVRLLHRLLLSQYNAFLVIGKVNKDFYLQYGIESDRIFPCPYFVDNKRFSQQSEKFRDIKDEIRASWDIPKETICFVYAGKLVPKKRIFDLLHSFQKATKRINNIFLLVVGTGELMEPAQHFAKSVGLPVSFTGFLNQTEITQAYVAGDCLVLPSDYGETWGLVVNEAMACGLPAIVSNRVGCGPDLIEEDVTGSIFPFGDFDALAQKMVDMAADPHKLQKMGQRAKELVLHNYSVEKAVEGTIKAIEATLGQVVPMINTTNQ